MRNLLVLMLIFAFWSCDGIEDSVVEPTESQFLVEEISAPTSVIYAGDTTNITTEIKFSNIESLNKIWFEFSSNDFLVSVADVEMLSNAGSPNTFSGTSKMNEEHPTGNYVINYYVNTLLQEKKKIASHILFYDNLKDVKFENLEAPNQYVYSEDNKYVVTTISFSNTYYLRNVWFSIKSSDGTIILTDSVKMGQTSGFSPFMINTFKDSLMMESSNSNNNYIIDYFIKTELESKIKVASHEFSFETDGANTPPVISNPLFYYIDEAPMLRDTLENNKEFIFSIYVTDENGLNDVDSVYTDFYSPNNPSAYRVILFDNGDDANGDEVAGDGIFSGKNIFVDAFGDRKFEFWARDNSGALSNMITHNVVVK
jgi:hypothetical protein